MSVRRGIDLGIVVGTAPLVLPIIAALALVNLLVEGRPVFFNQERVGKDGRLFRIWKLRTLSRHPDPTLRRASRWGLWLRQRGLDELPQAWNILRGDMSTVGPRPLTQADFDRLCAIHPPFAIRASVRPGITGLAQVCLARGAALTASLDAFYATNCGLGMDFRILVRTVWMHVVGKRRGARPLPPSVTSAKEVHT